jgi:hypothetical protein
MTLPFHDAINHIQMWYSSVFQEGGWFIVLTATIATFIGVFFRGFQNKNVAGGYKKMAFFTGYIMNVLDILVIGLVVNSGIGVVVISGLGAAFGYVVSMQVHEFFVGRKIKERKKIKKEIKKEKNRIALEQLIQNQINSKNGHLPIMPVTIAKE